MNKNKIRVALEALGFEMEELDDFGCKFQYEGCSYLWLYSDDDEDLLSIALPGIIIPEEGDEMIFHKLTDHLNGTLKYVKVNLLQDSMWLFYERELMGDEDLEVVIPRMISHLYHAMDSLQGCIERRPSDDKNDSQDFSIEDAIETDDMEIDDKDERAVED